MATDLKPAEAFHPGEYLRDELKERGWTQGDLAKVIGRSTQAVNEVVNGKRGVTAEMAKLLGAALGTGAAVWINMQATYDLFHAPEPMPDVARRAAALSHA